MSTTLRLFTVSCVLLALAACQSVQPTEPSALEIDSQQASSFSYAASAGQCMEGSVKVCSKEFTAEPFSCGCMNETQVRPLWNR